MKYTIKVLEKLLKRKFPTIMLYLSRAEFNHIKLIRTNKEAYFENMTQGDIATLKKLFGYRDIYIGKKRKK